MEFPFACHVEDVVPGETHPARARVVDVVEVPGLITKELLAMADKMTDPEDAEALRARAEWLDR